MLKISPTANISALADIEESTRGTLIEIGDRVTIDSFVKIKPAGGVGALRIGGNTTINSGCVLYTGNGIEIGHNCAIAANCTFASANHAIDDRERPIVSQGFMPSRGGIRLEDDVWVGANVVLLDGALLRRGCVIGAGSVVRGEIPPYAICAGSPARFIRYRGDRRQSERFPVPERAESA